MPANRMKRGTGIYACNCCTRLTRSTGRGDNDNVGLCAECYDLAGYENMLLDGMTLSDADMAHINEMVAYITAVGGNADKAFDYSLLETQ